MCDPTLVGLFNKCVKEYRHQNALLSEEGQSLATYALLDERSSYLASVILYHVEPNAQVPIGVTVEGEGVAETVLAILKTGNIVLPLSDKLPRWELNRILDESQTELIITSDEDVGNSPGSSRSIKSFVRGHVKCIDYQQDIFDQSTLSGRSGERLMGVANGIFPEHYAWWLYTSGSTGPPKSVLLTHGQLCARVLWGMLQFPFEAGERVFVKSSFLFVDFIAEMFQPLLSGVESVVPWRHFHTKDLILVSKMSRKLNVTRLLLVPSVARALVEAMPGRTLNLKYLFISGEVLTSKLLWDLRDLCPQAIIVNLYGSTETSGDVLSHEFHPGNPLPALEDPVPLGKPIGGNQVIIGDNSEIWVRGPFVAVQSKPRNLDEVGYWRTGDFGSVDSNGVFWFDSRDCDRVKIHGERVEVRSVEMHLQNICGPMSRGVVISFEDPLGEMRLCGFVSCTDVNGIRRRLEKVARPCMMPTMILELQDFPLTETGKVDRQALQKLAAEIYSETDDGFNQELQKVQSSGWDSLDLMRQKIRTNAQAQVEAVIGNLYWLAMLTVIIDHLRYQLKDDNFFLYYLFQFGLIFSMDVFFSFAALQDSALLFLGKFRIFSMRCISFAVLAYVMESVLQSGWVGWFLFRRSMYMISLLPIAVLHHFVIVKYFPDYESLPTVMWTFMPPMIGFILRYGFTRTDFIVTLFSDPTVLPLVFVTPPEWGDFSCLQYFVLPLLFGGACSGFSVFTSLRVRFERISIRWILYTTRIACVGILGYIVYGYTTTWSRSLNVQSYIVAPMTKPLSSDNFKTFYPRMPVVDRPVDFLSRFAIDWCSLVMSFVIIVTIAIILPTRTTIISKMGNDTLPCYLLHYPLTCAVAALCGGDVTSDSGIILKTFALIGSYIGTLNPPVAGSVAFALAICIQILLSYAFTTDKSKSLFLPPGRRRPVSIFLDGFTGAGQVCLCVVLVTILYAIGILGLYVFMMTLMAFMAGHRLYLCKQARKLPKFKEMSLMFCENDIGRVRDFPFVLIQLPLYNEERVCRRVIEHCCRMDYPYDRFRVQVLDDSDDRTEEFCLESIGKWKRLGVSIEYVRRPNRDQFKAGALAFGLRQFLLDGGDPATLVAIFDADFVPPSGFLRSLVPHFDRPEVGAVQARWGHLNRDYSFFTKSQGCLLDGHFLNEHCGRFFNKWFFNFNGSGGVWRAETIISAGGWSGRTLTEDLDLSFRAQLRGWELVFRPDVIVPAELPEDVDSFKIQQHRWAKGQLETAFYLLGDTLKHPNLSRRAKLDALLYLCGNATYPFVILLALTAPYVNAHGENHPFISVYVWFIGGVSPIIFMVTYWRAVSKAGVNRGILEHVIPAIIVGSALAVNNSKALIEVVLGYRSEFRRTPKCGAEPKEWDTPPVKNKSPLGVSSGFIQAFVELSIGLYLTYFVCHAFMNLSTGIITLPLMCVLQLGFLYFGIASLWSWVKQMFRNSVAVVKRRIGTTCPGVMRRRRSDIVNRESIRRPLIERDMA
eukprot:GEMP01002501.1.p1 GENE.GEMP01002501.1~~GEMP01002501.1.p1  ORF type:complete len:1502 (+),score=221.34 GEMP01002501.1:160-4665(+)